MEKKKFVCVHGHFYQPPRENPWLDFVEAQDSARPYHDWNARVSAECYAPNTAARILGDQGRIRRIVNNFTHISFNFGPTLLHWMEKCDPLTYEAIVQADKDSIARLGHGSAMAQVYNHIIMPLASSRDKLTQIRWGKYDFISRFGREPEGMWMSETAVNTETLELMAAEGIKFVIMAPHQAASVRPQPDAPWQDVSGSRVDPRRAYKVNLPNNKSITAFFYDGPVSQSLAFENLLDDGARFAGRILGLLDQDPPEAQLAHLATDGESYGHHHRFGDMALAFAIQLVEDLPDVNMINYASFMAEHPAQWEAQIVENSSWSCVHGIERWRSDCGCGNTRADWNQAWRAPLRQAFDNLRDGLDQFFESQGGRLLRDPWTARNDYIEVMINPGQREEFLARHQKAPLSEADAAQAMYMLESQRYRLYMYTSCGWFFDELSGLEPMQNICYATQALLSAQRAGAPADLLDNFLADLAKARSNMPEKGTGADLWRNSVKPQIVEGNQVVAHAVMSSLVSGQPLPNEVYAYEIITSSLKRQENLNLKILWGTMAIRHKLVGEVFDLSFAAVYTGGHDLKALVLPSAETVSLDDMEQLTDEPLSHLEASALWEIFQRKLPAARFFTMADLFLEDRRRLANDMLRYDLVNYRQIVRTLYDGDRVAMRYLREINVPLPPVFTALAQAILKWDLQNLLEESRRKPIPSAVGQMVMQARELGLELQNYELSELVENMLFQDMDGLDQAEGRDIILKQASDLLSLGKALDLNLNLWQAQNRFYELMQAHQGEPMPPELAEMGRKLNFEV